MAGDRNHPLWRQVRSALKHREPKRARDLIVRYLREYPTDLQAQLMVVQIDLDRHQWDVAGARLERLLRDYPQVPDLYVNLGYVRKLQGRQDDARALWQEALRVQPGYVPALGNLANDAYHRGDIRGVDAYAAMAMYASPKDGVSRLNQGFADLVRGRWVTGWAFYERRWWMAGHTRWNPAPPQPWWQGAPVGTLCVWHEQGVGDALMMLRYDGPIKARGVGRVVWTLPERLLTLAAAAGYEAVSKRETPVADAYVALMSLPYVFTTTPEDVPPAPYIALREAA